MIEFALGGWLVAALVALLPLLLGRAARRAGEAWMSLRLAVLLGGAATSGLLVAWLDLDADSDARHPGVAAGIVAFVFVAAPIVGFYSLGYRVRRGRLLGALWLAASIPFTAYVALVTVVLVPISVCAVDCPLS